MAEDVWLHEVYYDHYLTVNILVYEINFMDEIDKPMKSVFIYLMSSSFVREIAN